MTGDQAAVTEPEINVFMEQLKRRTKFIVPPDGFDVRGACPQQLIDLGLPPRPEDPQLRRMWNVFFAGSPKFCDADTLTIAKGTGDQPVRAKQRHTPDSLAALPGHVLSSLNWSGATVAPSGGRRFREICGIWKVPPVTAPPPPPSGTAKEYFSSIFIGLDGQRRYFDASLPQIGTRQDITAEGVRYETWFQWFTLNTDNWPTKLGVRVTPGQQVMAWITVLTPTKVRMMIRNFDRVPPEACIFEVDACKVATVGGMRQPRVSGATAQWIFERPTSKAGVFETLPVFDEVAFADCFAVADGTAAGPKVHELVGARLHRMRERRAAPYRAVKLAVPDMPPGLRLRIRRA